jgi:uncharacterized protein YdaU (DUF1376 family)
MARGSGTGISAHIWGRRLNYYPHHIGDYLTATAHLTWLEDAAYRRLMDVYYTREQPIPSDIAQACRLVRAGSKEEKRAVETVLREFFQETPEGWRHGRCDEEIEKASAARTAAQQNGKLGGRPRKQKPSNNPDETQPVSDGLAKHNPDETGSKAPNPNTQSQTQITTSVPDGTGGEPPGIDPKDALFQIAVPWLVDRGVKESNARSLLGGASKHLGDTEAWNLASACMTEKPMDPAAWIAGALNKQIGKKPGASRHGNFAAQDYRAGVAADGSF